MQRAWLVAVGCAILVLAGPAVVGSVDAGTSGSQAAVNESANATDRPLHERPEAVGSDGDLDAVSRWLAGRLGGSLEESAIELSQGEYERARALVGEEYDRWLGQFVEVSGDTEGDGDDQATDDFDAAQDDQRQFATAVEEFERTRRAYEAAREAGNEQRARELARQLDAQARAVTRLNDSLQGHYSALETQAGVNLSEGRRATANTTTVVRTQRDAVIDEVELEATTLRVEAERQRVSVLQPLVVSGTLRAATNGTGLANRKITLTLANTTATTATDATGRFTATLRPAPTTPLAAEAATVAFEPAPEAAYLGTQRSVPVDIEQVDASLTLTTVSETASLTEEMTVAGQVTAAETPVAAVPVTVTLGGIRLGQTQTGPDGQFRLDVSLPAATSTGTQPLVARIGLEGQAVRGDSATTQVDVAATPTTLTLTANATTPGRVRVAGTFETTSGIPIRGGGIDLAVNGARVATARTDADGRYGATVTVPPAAFDDANTTTVTVRARYGAAGLLENATATTTVTVTRPAEPSLAERLTTAPVVTIQETTRGLLDRAPSWLLGVVALVAVGMLLAGYYLRAALWAVARGVLRVGLLPVLALRRVLGWLAGGQAQTGTDTAGASATEAGDGPAEATASDPAASPLDTARDLMAAGAFSEAIDVSYAATRARLREGLAGEDKAGEGTDSSTPGADARTHWEFYEACAADGFDPDTVGAFRELTDYYERATYAPGAVDRETAEAALQAAERVTSGVSRSPP